VTDGDVAGPGSPARVQVRGTGERSEQRRLAGPVAADNADALPCRDAQRDAIKQNALVIRLGGELQVYQVHDGCRCQDECGWSGRLWLLRRLAVADDGRAG